VKLGDPIQLKVKAGDIVLAHYQLAHTIAPNISSNIRYAIYFRLHSENHKPETYRPETLTNIWLDYPSMKNVVDRLNPSTTTSSSSSNSFLSNYSDPRMKTVQQLFEKAVSEDKAKKFEIALDCYQKGLVILLDIIKKEQNQQYSQQLKEYASKYMSRAEQLKKCPSIFIGYVKFYL